jgi:hypothetical protein
MPMASLLDVVWHGLIGFLISANLLYADQVSPDVAPPGTYHTSWIGNSFGGAGALPGEGVRGRGNGFGYWVQDSIGAMAVSPDGTVFLGTLWDESGRTVGLYKNGHTNRVIVKALASPFEAWGFNTANTGLCVDGNFFYVGNLGRGLLKFRWMPGDLNSAQYLDATALPEKAVGLSCSNGKILVGYPDQIELRDENSMQLIAAFPIGNLSAVLLAPDGSFWVIAGGQVHHLQANGNDTGVILPGIGKPTSLAWAKNGTLIVSDDGPRQQVLFFDVSGPPRLTSSFGVEGGVYSGTAGAVAPQKLFALRGAGMDAAGDLYVGMGFAGIPTGNTYLRAFSPSGKLLWENYATAFLDAFDFEPGSDGTMVYGRTTLWQLDLDRQTPGSEATLKAITVDPLRYPNDLRLTWGYSVNPRLIDGTQLLYAIGQTGKGFIIFAGSPGTYILHQVDRTPKTGWSWYVTDDGDIWNGDAPGRKIALYELQSITGGKPVYDWQHPRTWPWPADFQRVDRVIYQKNTDTLYVFGLEKGQSDNGGWGTLGFTARRYDGWLAGHPSVRWTNTSLPGSPRAINGKTLPAKDVSLAGDYLFLGMARDGVKTYASKVAIVNAATGQYAGTLQAGPEVGGVGGWEDMVGSIHATKRANGEYLILVEDDWHAKNLLFRWTP